GTLLMDLKTPLKIPPKPNSNETQKPPDSKKTKVVGISERTAELKAKFGFLKKKPADFDPKTVACWEKGERVPFLFLRLASDLLSNETSQILITGIGCNMLRTVIYTKPDDLLAMAYLAANKLAPTHEGLDLGIGEASIIKFLADAYGRIEPHIKSQLAAKIVKQVFSVLPVYDKVVPALLTSGKWNLRKTCSFTVGVPVEPMKAKSTNSVAKIVNKFQDADFVCEYKYDGERAQKILSFQILSTRARKNVLLSNIKVDEQLGIRKERLYDSFEKETGFFQFATALMSNDLEEIQSFLNSSVSSSCGGLIIKTLDRNAKYEPSKLSLNWLKLKKDYLENTLDLVPVAAFHGKQTGVCGSFLLACYDDNNEEYQGICKIGIGFTEAVCEECSASLRSKVIPEPKLAMTLVRRLSSFFHNKVGWDVCAPTLHHDREKHRSFTDC
ncbi:hypothetical protein E1A91_A08G220400v1, partial [Gossypium mustelinum]